MYGRAGLDRFKKAQTLEPFSVNSASKATTQLPPLGATTSHIHSQSSNQQIQNQDDQKPDVAAPATQVGGGQTNWQPPEWAIEPRPGVYYLEVMKDGQALDRIDLDKRRHIFGRQFQTCDFVLDHQSVSRQHAAVVPHKNGGIYVIDLGSAHGTFVANERLAKDSPVELEAGQSLRFAASTRLYFLRKNDAALFPPPPPTDIDLPPPPDPCDEDAVVAYNTFLNRYGLPKPDSSLEKEVPERSAKRIKRARVAFKDQVGGELVEVVGFSDGADVDTEPGPVSVKEGSLVGKYESLVQTTVIPKGKESSSVSVKEIGVSPNGVTDKLQEVLNKVRTSAPKTGIYDDLYGGSLSGKVGSSWAYPSTIDKQATPVKFNASSGTNSSLGDGDDSDDDLFG